MGLISSMLSVYIYYTQCNVSICKIQRVKPKTKIMLIKNALNDIFIEQLNAQNKTYEYCNDKKKKQTNSNSV